MFSFTLSSMHSVFLCRFLFSFINDIARTTSHEVHTVKADQVKERGFVSIFCLHFFFIFSTGDALMAARWSLIVIDYINRFLSFILCQVNHFAARHHLYHHLLLTLKRRRRVIVSQWIKLCACCRFCDKKCMSSLSTDSCSLRKEFSHHKERAQVKYFSIHQASWKHSSV